MNNIKITSPRDYFSKEGLFITPPNFKRSSPYEGIESSIDNFISKLMTGLHFPYELNKSELTSQILMV